MRITRNTSPYRTRDIERIVRRAIEPLYRGPVGRGRFSMLRVRVGTSYRCDVWGEATLGTKDSPFRGTFMLLTIGKTATPEILAAVAAHEAMHNMGAKHGDMAPAQLYCWTHLPAEEEGGEPRPRFPWAAALPLRLKTKNELETERKAARPPARRMP